jgi:ATP-dependent DNA ligase
MNQIFKALAADNSRLTKEKILKDNLTNLTLRKVLFLALDPYTQFYIKRIPPYKTGVIRSKLTLEQALYELDKLSSRTVTGNAAFSHLHWILESLSADDAEVITRIIEKDLRCGVSEATVNKIWPKLIPTYPVMLASGYDEKLMAKMQYPAYVQLKLDGMRFNAIVRINSKTVEFRSRNGKLINLLGNLEQEFLELAAPFVKDVVFDGELIVRDNNGIMNRQKGNGILNKAVKDTISTTEASMVHATIWDVVPFEKFYSGVDDTAYNLRFRMLEQLNFPNKISLIESQLVNNEDEAHKLFQSYFAKGEEGIILKNPAGNWEDKRVKHQIKFKGELECDLLCVDWQEGTGKNKGRLGALVLESSDGKIKVNVGSGFTDEQRDKYTKQNTLGKVVAVKYNARIRDKNTNEESLFLPVFLELREDKYVADSSKDIK